MLVHLLSQRCLWLSSFFFILFLYYGLLQLFPPFYLLPAHLSVLPVILLLIPPLYFLISVIVLFITDYLFFISCRSLLNISSIFLIHASIYLFVPLFYFQVFGSFLSLLWILFQVNSLFPLHLVVLVIFCPGSPIGSAVKSPPAMLIGESGWLCFVEWSWIWSLWRAMPHPVAFVWVLQA